MVAWADLENDEVRAVATTEIHSYPRRRFMCIRFVGGRNMKEWMAPMLEKITDYALHSGCDALTGGGRGGWIKAAGFRDAGVFLMKDLR